MASRVAKQRVFQRWFIRIVIGTAVTSELLLIGAMLATVLYFKASFSPVIEACHDEEARPISGASSSLAIGMICLVVGISYDAAMFRFLKKRQNQVKNSVAMVAWKPSEQIKTDQEKENSCEQPPHPPFVSWGSNDYTSRTTIPIKATLLGVINLLILLALIYIFTYGFGNPSWASFFLQTSAMVSVTLHMPLVLLFTIKSNEKTSAKLNIRPPEGLHFHE